MGRSRELAELASAYDGSSLQFRNRIINGAMTIDQRNSGASVTPTANGQYTLDRWRFTLSQPSKFSTQQQTNPALAGFNSVMQITSLSAYAVPSTELFVLQQFIEGNNVSDLKWGTSAAQAVTLSFWVNTSLTGTFGGSLFNSNGTRSYPFSYVVSAANTWEQKVITIPGDTAGTWLKDNGAGITVNLGLGVGSTLSGTAGAWAGALYYSTTGAVSVVGTNAATFYITGVQLEAGTVATPFERRPYGAELALCQRYYETGSFGYNGSYQIGGSGCNFTQPFAVVKRAAPTMVGVSVSAVNLTGPALTAKADGFIYGGLATATGVVVYAGGFTASAEI